MTSSEQPTTSDQTAAPTAMNILVVGAKPGKGDAHIDKFLPSLAATRHQIAYVGWDRTKSLPRQTVVDGVPHRHIFRGGGFGGKGLLLFLPLWCLRLLLYLTTQRADLMIASDLDAALSTAIVCTLRRIPFVYVILDQYALRPTIPGWLQAPIQFVDDWVIRRAAYLIVPDETRIPAGLEGSEKCLVMYNCAPDIADDVAAERKERAGKPLTIYANGRLLKNRGIKLLLDAARQVGDVHLLMAGNAREPDVIQQIESTPTIDSRGRVSLEESLELNFDADAVFTFYEPSCEINRRAASNKWSDAMMAARPMIVNAELVKADWVRQNDIGYVCPYDTDALVDCLRQIKEHRDEAREKGRRGRYLYEHGYNWEAMEQRLYELLDKIASARAAAVAAPRKQAGDQ